jgi:hypothetical protein
VNASTRYIDHGMTVTDLSTCLEWEKKGQTGESSLHNAPDKYDWNAAVGYWLALVNDEFFAGHNDWRLPSEDGVIDVASSVRELLSIVDCGFRPTINPIFGPTATFTGYWSTSSRYVDNFYVVEYTDGWEYEGYDDTKQAVRAVRGGP